MHVMLFWLYILFLKESSLDFQDLDILWFQYATWIEYQTKHQVIL